MKTEEKNMMNPVNWGKEEIKEATKGVLLSCAGLVLTLVAMWIFC